MIVAVSGSRVLSDLVVGLGLSISGDVSKSLHIRKIVTSDEGFRSALFPQDSRPLGPGVAT